MFLIKEIKKDDMQQEKDFLKKMNISFMNRSSNRIPFQKINSIFDIENRIVLGAYEESTNLLVGGVCIDFKCNKDKNEISLIRHVWTDVNYKKRGIATKLIKEAEEISILKDSKIMVLNVANIYEPALNLYKKLGFIEYKMIANMPRTFYLIQMIKPINNFKISKIKIWIKFMESKLKFKILYNNDSSLSKFHKVIVFLKNKI